MSSTQRKEVNLTEAEVATETAVASTEAAIASTEAAVASTEAAALATEAAEESTVAAAVATEAAEESTEAAEKLTEAAATAPQEVHDQSNDPSIAQSVVSSAPIVVANDSPSASKKAVEESRQAAEVSKEAAVASRHAAAASKKAAVISSGAAAASKRCCDWAKLTSDEIASRMVDLPMWQIIDNDTSINSSDNSSGDVPKLSRTIVGKDFKVCLKAIRDIGDIAEELQHHPDIHLTSYKNIEIVVYTHSLSGITDNDVRLCKAIDQKVRLEYNMSFLKKNPHCLPSHIVVP